MNFWDEAKVDAAAERKVLSVRQVNDAISQAIDRAFPSTIWVRGEVQRFPPDAAQRKHLYFELQETGGSGAAEYQVAVALMGWDRQRYGLSRYVDGTDPDFQIANKMEVCLQCKVDFYAKFGKISLKILGVDKTFALGKLEARRRETLAFLTAQGLLETNASVPMPELPLKVGLITSEGSAAHHDFMTGINGSGWAFEVKLQSAKMQGELLQAEVIAAIAAHSAAGVDVIVITRGGGSRADLSWFDQKDLAVTVAQCSVPVITAIGHEIDSSIADVVAHHSCKTPTAAAEFLVELIDQAARRLDVATDQLARLSNRLLEQESGRLKVADLLLPRVERLLMRASLGVQNQAGLLLNRVTGKLSRNRKDLGFLENRIQGGTIRILLGATGRYQGLHPRLQRSAGNCLSGSKQILGQKVNRLAREIPRFNRNADQKLKELTDKARLLDPARLLARGFSQTKNSAGQTIVSSGQVSPGETLLTRFAEGSVRSTVQPGAGIGAGKKSQNKGKKSGSKQKETGQKSLFR